MNWSLLKIAPEGTHHLNENGLPAYAERFDEVLKFHAPGFAPVVRRGEAWHIRPDGSPVYARRFSRAFGFYEGFAAVEGRAGGHHIMPDGQDAYGDRYAWCGNFQGGRCTVRQTEGTYLHIVTNGRPAYTQRWKYAGDYRDGIAVVQARNGRSTHIDTCGCLVHGEWFVDLDVFHKGYARARDEDGWMHVNMQGKPIYTRRFAAVEPFYNGQARVERFDGALEVIDEAGRGLVELRPPIRSEFAALSTMSHEQDHELPSHLEELRQEAKRLRRESAHEQSYEKNKQLAEESRRQHCEIGEVLGLRFMGVCMYRLGRFEESHQWLVKARDRAHACNLHQQELYIANHLGATLRHLGNFDEAYKVFRDALERVRLPQDLEARARLLGSLGAFYDEIGNLRGSEDCYARYEELVELIVFSGNIADRPRLANARAFAGRVALRHGDLETAKTKFDDEYRIANESKDQLRIRDAIFHQAKIHLELGLQDKQDSHFDKVATRFEEAYELFAKNNQRSRMADLLHHRARLHEARGQWAEAYDAWREAWSISSDCKHLYRQAQSSLELARFCQRWALHGESLYWFRKAARIRLDQYAPFAKSERIAGLAQTRLAELHDVAKKLADESRRVEREKDESKDIDDLVKKVTRKSINELSAGNDSEPVRTWQVRVRKESLDRWNELLSPEIFGNLKRQSQDDLVMADVLYHGVVDELPRSALLIAIVAERELREHVFVPIHEAYAPHRTGEKPSWSRGRPPATVQYLHQEHSDNVPIGNAFRMLQEILDKPIHHAAVAFARDFTRSWHDKLRLIVRLNDMIEPVGSSTDGISFAELRNDAAHGGERVAKLDRITVDAMKRRLFLQSPSILASILDTDLR